MIKLASDTISREDTNALAAWLLQDPVPRLTMHKLTEEFEAKWSELLGVKHSVFVNSGSSAILLSLYGLLEGGYFKNKKIVVPGLGWVTDVSSCMQIGLEPILCDCNLSDLSVDLEHLEQLFIEHEPAGMILVSVLGLVPEMEKIQALCKEYDVVLIEDVAESTGAEYQGVQLGTYGKVSIFSLFYGHHISTIEGGMISTDDEELYEILVSLRSHGWDRNLSTETQQRLRGEWGINDFDCLYTFYYPGFNLRPTDLQAFLGLRQLDKIFEYKSQRRRNFYVYNRLIKGNLLSTLERPGDFVSNFAYPVVSKKRNKIVSALRSNNIEVRPLIAGSIGRSPFWIKKYGINELKNCDLINDYGFYIPNHHALTDADVFMVSEIINQVTLGE